MPFLFELFPVFPTLFSGAVLTIGFNLQWQHLSVHVIVLGSVNHKRNAHLSEQNELIMRLLQFYFAFYLPLNIPMLTVISVSIELQCSHTWYDLFYSILLTGNCTTMTVKTGTEFQGLLKLNGYRSFEELFKR